MSGWQIENYLEIKNNGLHIDGVSAVELAEEFGTPLFVFSQRRIRENIGRIKRAERKLDCPLKVCYAAKANSNMGVLRTVLQSGADLEVNSGGELYKALKIGFRPRQIIFNGTSKTERELEEAIEAGIYAIQADSIFEIELTEKVARKLNKRANISLRLVPEIESDTLSGLQTALLTSKFGMMPGEALEAFRRWEPENEFLDLCGIHLHIGSQNPKSEPYAEALKTLFENLWQIHNETGHRLKHLNLGGGFPVNYLRDLAHHGHFSDRQRDFFAADLDPAEVLQSAWAAMKEAAREAEAEHLLDDIELLVEPGRSVIADAGICLTTVRNKKERPIRDLKSQIPDLNGERSEIRDPKSQIDIWLLTDAGFNLLLSMETYKWYYQLISAERAGADHDARYKVAGPLCDGGDVYFDIEGEGRLPDYRQLPESVGVGEILALLNCGAYSIAQMFPYNGRELPAVVLIGEGGRIEPIRKRDSYEDLLINDIY
ncbi:MAG: diaminopimelate decarboxylase [Pyrinomonadaceae bacterium]